MAKIPERAIWYGPYHIRLKVKKWTASWKKSEIWGASNVSEVWNFIKRVLKIQSAVEFGLVRKTKSDAFWSLNFMHSRILRITDFDWHIDRFLKFWWKNRHWLS